MKILTTLVRRMKIIPTWAWITISYALVHLPSLILLPVFADEAIYIRWAQLIQDDIARYAFFSMADGKPPLFMWILSLMVRPPFDPLWIARFSSLVIGLATVFVLRALIKEFTQNKIGIFAVTAIGIGAPFWFFYHRMALMDGLLTLLLSLTFLFTIRLSVSGEKKREYNFRLQNALCIAISFGLAMMTKTPALFAVPIIAVVPVFFWWEQGHRKLSDLVRLVMWVGGAGIMGIVFFLSLRVSPLFGALFARSSDFTFSFTELFSGEWKYVFLKSFPHNVGWIISYMTPELCVIAVLGLVSRKYRSRILFLLFCFLLFLSPLTLVGRVLWPRYFLPSIIFLTLAIGVSITALFEQKKLKLICQVLILLALIRAAYFLGTSYLDVRLIPFVKEDKVQYLEEWSAGFGNREVRDFIIKEQQLLPENSTKKIVILTEGSFGTLPDGLLMYFHSGNARNIEVHGIGVSVPAIPAQYVSRAKSDDVYYVLNSHRFGIINTEMLRKIMEVKRPNGPSLLLYKVTVK